MAIERNDVRLTGINRFLEIAVDLDEASQKMFAESDNYIDGDGKVAIYLQALAYRIRHTYEQAVRDEQLDAQKMG